MTKPKAYDPQEGYQFQIFCRQAGEWEHCDYAKDLEDKKFLIGEYKVAFGPSWEFKSEMLPMKFWPKRVPALAGALALLSVLIIPGVSQARISCTETLTGNVVCVDSESGQTFTRREKLTGEVDYVETDPGRRRHHKDREDRRHEHKD